MSDEMLIAINTESPEETFKLGKEIGKACKGGEVFMLHGTLGTGKTCLLQGLGRGLGIPEAVEIVSPTFVIHCQYEGEIVFNHIDAYRLDGAEDISSLGFEEMFEDKDAVTAVEWAEIIDGIIPEEIIEIEIEMTSQTSRKFNFKINSSQLEIFSQVIKALENFK